jgi:hypothetical protein
VPSLENRQEQEPDRVLPIEVDLGQEAIGGNDEWQAVVVVAADMRYKA